MKVKKISIQRKNINKKSSEERYFFYMAQWFLNDLMMLRNLYYFSTNMKNAQGLEVYARNCRTLFLSCILSGKIYEGWKLLKHSYFHSKWHIEYEKYCSNEVKSTLKKIKKYFSNKKTLIAKLRNISFHFPSSKSEDSELKKMFEVDDFDEKSECYIGNTFENSIFTTDRFVANFCNRIGAKNIKEANKLLNKDIKKLVPYFCIFMEDYIYRFFEKSDSQIEIFNLDNCPQRDSVFIPFFSENIKNADL